MPRYQIEIHEMKPKKEPGCLAYLVVAFLIYVLIAMASK